MIENLQGLIAAKERQMGTKIVEPEIDKEKPEEITEIMKLLFTYVQKSITQLNEEITIIKDQQQKILEILKKNDKE